MKKLLYIIIGVTLLVACSEQKKFVNALDRAKTITNDYPDSALSILDSLSMHEEEFSKHFKMQYQLHRINTYNKLDSTFRSTKEAQELADYFKENGTANEQMLAYYLLGRTYYDTHEAPMALRCFQIASEKADTTSDDCDYRQLSRIYGQMSNIFYQQNLMERSLESGEKAIKYGWKGKDTLNTLLEMGGQVYTYERLLKKDMAVIACENVVSLLEKNGHRQLAAAFLGSIIRNLIESGQKEKAKKYMNIYEVQSGYFDNNGNIEKGREIYYYSKGQYFLASQQYDSAEYYFRKELRTGKDFNNQNAASRGLAQLFQQKHIGDSAAKYALYSYEMNDSVYARMATNEVEQMKTLYDYSHNQEIAHQEKEKAKSEHIKAQIASVITLLIIIITIAVIRRERRKHKVAISKYEQSISDLAKVQADIIKLRAHKSEYEHLISNKEKEVNRLNSEIYLYKEKLGKQKESAESLLIKSQEYSDLRKYAGRGVVFSDEMWHKVDVMVIDILPNFYKFISSKKLELNDHEFKVCILIRLHLTPKEVANAIGLSPSSITKIRNNMMKKLFGMEGKSKELDEKLLQYS
jgi:hypothetical protein